MTDKELHKLNRKELLEILLKQQQEIDHLKNELEQAEKKMQERKIIIENAGSLAEASIAMTNLLEEAQKAADIYLHNIYALGNEYMDAIDKKEKADEQNREVQPD